VSPATAKLSGCSPASTNARHRWAGKTCLPLYLAVPVQGIDCAAQRAEKEDRSIRFTLLTAPHDTLTATPVRWLLASSRQPSDRGNGSPRRRPNSVGEDR